jgi:hypothetical protein
MTTPTFPGLFDDGPKVAPGEYHKLVRTTDPETSRRAAQTQTAEHRAFVRDRVARLFEALGAMTDRQLVDAYRAQYGRETPESTIRTRRAELVAEQRVRAAHVLSGPRGQTVWTLT